MTASVGSIPGAWLKVQPPGRSGSFSIKLRALPFGEWETAIAARRIPETTIEDWAGVRAAGSRDALPFSANALQLMLTDQAVALAILQRIERHVRNNRRGLERHVHRLRKESQHGR